ncbi:MAG: ribonuclease HII [Candidatus Odinarchaeum yellowstonii]|uniref:Ribonuclease n=1 Tax=Odinarchaeota yellowstonii (strain LCB_4) TaxID=1841599 RepID=A0AAF0D1M4_ODILC|nr:MAG: ribonuclease HII [Candidatus Odinarchaeum yellowstonii]
MNDGMILGIDEAGRGPVVGPMVICGAIIREDKLSVLAELNPVDSKKLSPRQREWFREKLEKLLDGYKILVVEPREIDAYVVRNRLNHLETVKFLEIIRFFKPSEVYVDAPVLRTERFARILSVKLDYKPRIIAENKAEKYHIVAAASILAKTTRDRLINELEKVYGEFGTGYCHDPKTINFINNWIQKHRSLPDIVRKSWVTSKNWVNKFLQTKLTF